VRPSSPAVTTRIALLAALPAALLAAALLAGPAPSSAQVCPGAAWETRTPESLGLDSAKLAELQALVGGSGLIVRSGYRVWAWGDVTAGHNWASASKPLLTSLLFLAADEGLCTLDTAVGDFLAGGSVEDRAITFRQLANMVSGYSRAEGPTEAWAYNDHAINLYGYTLCHEVFGDTPQAVVDSRLSFLQFQDPVLIGGARYGRIESMSIRDFARLGWLWCLRGFWAGAQRLPAAAFDLVTNQVSPSLPLTAADGSESWDLGTFGGSDDQDADGRGHYGMTFWVNTNGLWPGVPADAFQANGHFGGEVCTVLPSLGLVAVGVGSWGDPTAAALQLLVEAVDPATAVENGLESRSWGSVKDLYRGP
jgi:CubicO group peptidase (beta-lactamase class C family)